MIKSYGNISVDEQYLDSVEKLENNNCKYTKVYLPANVANEISMQQRGFVFADRVIDVSISVAKCGVNLDKLIRLQIIHSQEYKDEIFEISKNSFTYDRRFHVAKVLNSEIANTVIRHWVENLTNTSVALFKGKVVGFIDLKKIDDTSLFVNLAAVDEKYRMSGAALSLYANAVLLCKNGGYKKLQGTISSQNIAVMNLYSYFGAVFLNPQDIFIKEA